MAPKNKVLSGGQIIDAIQLERYSLSTIRAELLEKHGIKIDISHLSRIKNAQRPCTDEMRKALVEIHGRLCK